MSNLRSKVKSFIAGEEGTTSVEYAVMLVLIVGACIAAITSAGGQGGNMWANNETEILNAFN